jgi:hypothetical protein
MSKRFLAQYGTPAHQDKLHNSYEGKRALISHGTDEDRSKIMNHHDFPKQTMFHVLISIYGTQKSS